jgi:predicted Ser/Thr protein kinase
MSNWNLDSEQAIEAIEAARGYDRLGIRFGELANIVVEANW